MKILRDPHEIMVLVFLLLPHRPFLHDIFRLHLFIGGLHASVIFGYSHTHELSLAGSAAYEKN